MVEVVLDRGGDQVIRPILVALLVAGPLVACGGDDAADPVTTTFVSATEPTATAVTATGETQTSGTSVDAQVVRSTCILTSFQRIGSS